MSFVLDSSSYVGHEGFEKMKEFVKAGVEYFSPDTTKTAIIEFVDKATVKLSFNRAISTDALTAEIDALPFQGQKSPKISEGLESAYSQLIRVNAGRKFVVLITAAQSNDPAEQKAITVAKERLERNGVHIIVVGIGNTINKESLETLSSPDSFYEADDFDNFIGLIQPIRESLCEKA